MTTTDDTDELIEREHTLRDELDALIERGLGFGNAVSVFASKQDDEARAYRDAADSGDGVEVDADAMVSVSADDGAYVMAWVWVPNSDVDWTPEQLIARWRRYNEDDDANHNFEGSTPDSGNDQDRCTECGDDRAGLLHAFDPNLPQGYHDDAIVEVQDHIEKGG